MANRQWFSKWSNKISIAAIFGDKLKKPVADGLNEWNFNPSNHHSVTHPD
jgi:hypothetical protein